MNPPGGNVLSVMMYSFRRLCVAVLVVIHFLDSVGHVILQ